ncbi:S-layer family protein [Tumebacillus sp. BK434]|uniref:phosphodiester glycosidase family protein n=1 Tax=Tumebacillus sp. BK434 TaxID=2512169 RepID=UPI001043ED06|nr:phosphodiester glycosidase family protein [Tumebacillus sp. BK434]TCP53935.1 S-layer family protein [Tumebacillus sp. BK434]
MKIKQGLKKAHAMLLGLSMIFGTTSGAFAAPADQIYSWPEIVSKTESKQVIVTKGVTYQTINYDTKSGPIVLHETWVNLTDPNVEVKTVMSGDKLENQTNETVSGMARRTGAVAGVNGDFFESESSGMALGMSVQDGQLLHHPNQTAVLGIGFNDEVIIGKYAFNGTVTASNGKTYGIKALNGHPVTYPNDMVLLTPELGYWEMVSNATIVTLQKQPDYSYKVTSIDPMKTVTEAPPQGYVKLVAQGSGPIGFVTANLQKGDLLNLAYGTTPASTNLKYAIGGGPILLKDGQYYADPNQPLPNSSSYRGPITGVGVTADGKRMLQLVVDGRSSASIGLTYVQTANYMKSRGLANAMLLDGGGSTEMVVRQPGDTQATVTNVPSDGRERRVANGLFIYSTSQPGAPANVTNWGETLNVFIGEQKQLTKKYSVLDEFYNPLPGEAVTFSIEPSTLGNITQNGLFLAGKTGGTGKIIAASTANPAAKTEIPVTVYSSVDGLTLTPNVIDLGGGETYTFTAKGTVAGETITLKPELLTWSSSNSTYGTVVNGTFTASQTSGNGMTTVTAKIGTKSASASVYIGYVQKTVEKLDNAALWKRTDRWGDVGTLTTSTAQFRAPYTASTAVNYRFAAGSGLKQFVFYPANTLSLPANTDNAAVNPVGVGLWVYGDNSGLKLIGSFEKGDGTLIQSANSVRIDWSGWKYVTLKFPANATFPLKLDYLDLIAENQTGAMNGTVYLNDLQVVYAARTYKDKPPVPTVVTFPDIANHWGRSMIETLATKGIVQGLDKDHFAPAAQLTRAQAATLIVNALGIPDAVSNTPFRDVKAGAWYEKKVGAAVNAGLASGTGAGTFAPDAFVDRNQIAVMIYNALKYKQKLPTGGTPIPFKDAKEIETWAVDKVNTLSAAGIMIGSDGYLRPKAVTDRGEAAALIYKMMQQAGLL